MKKSSLLKTAITALLLSFTTSMFAASTITGYVKADALGDPLPGVNVLIQGTSTGVTTNLYGQYSLSVTTGVTITLVCSAIGYSTIYRTITPVTGTNYVNFWFNNPSPPTASISGTTSVCRNAASPNITFTGANGVAPYTFTYKINSGSNLTVTTTSGNSVTVSVPTNTDGNYTYSLVSVWDVNSTVSVSGSATVTVNALPATPTISAGGPTTFCSGGSVTLTSSAGTTYLWSNSATTSSINVTSSGSYTVRITNSFGCQSAVSLTTAVTVNSLPATPTITAGGPTTFCSGGSVTLTSSAGTTYLWSNSATTSSINATSTGSYTVRVTNSSGCLSAASAATSVTVNPLPATPTITAGGPTTFCSGGNVTLTSSAGTTYLWSNSATSSSINATSPGSYTVRVTNSSGCQSAASAATVVTVNSLPATPIIGSITHPTCILPTGSVELSGLPSAGTWTLTRTPGATISTGTGISTTISGLAPGTYTYTVSDGISSCTSVSSGTVVINTQAEIPAAPAIGVITQPTCILTTGSVELAGLPSSGTWTLTRFPGGITSTGTGSISTISNLPPGTYNYTVANASGCTSLVSANVVINSQPGIPATPTIGTITQPTCTVPAGSVVLNGLPSTGTWTITSSPGGYTKIDSGTGSTISGLPTGNYSFTVTDASGCISLPTSNIVITPNASAPLAPVIGSVSHPTCSLSTGSVILNGLPSTGTWTLTKTPGGATINGSGNSTTISGLSAGTYTYTVSDESGCISLSSNNVVINSQPVTPSAPSIGPITQPTCSVETGSVILNGLPLTGSWTLTRSPGGSTTTGNGISSTLSGLSSGIFTFSVTNEAGCTSILSDNVAIGSSISATTPAIGPVTAPTCLVPSGSVVLNGLPAIGAWTLMGPGGTTTTGTGTSYTMAGLAPGTYSYAVRNTSGCLSAASADIVIPVLKPGVIPKIKTKWSGNILVCSNKSDSITSYQWYNGTSPITNAKGQYYVTNKQSGIYKVETTDKNSCKNFSNQISIAGTKSLTLYPNPASVDFSIKLDDEAEGSALITIINSSGIRVMEFETEIVKNELLKTIPVNNLDKGIYIVNVLFRNEELYSGKVIITR